MRNFIDLDTFKLLQKARDAIRYGDPENADDLLSSILDSLNLSSPNQARLAASHTELVAVVSRLIRKGEREAAEAGENITPWLDDARLAIQNARKAVRS